MKTMNRRIALILAVVMIWACFGCAALADGEKFVTATTGKALKVKASTVYKLKVPKYSIVTITMSNKAGSRVSVGLYGTKDFDGPFVSGCNIYTEDKNAEVSRVLGKGVYYIKSKEEPDYDSKVTTPTATIKLTVTPVADDKNYSPSTAKLIKAYKKTRVAISPMTLYTRWYKIKLTKNKKLSIYGQDSDGRTIEDWDVYVLNSKLEQVKMVYNGSSVKPGLISQEKLPAGTYYIHPKNIGDYYDDETDLYMTAFDVSYMCFYWA